MKHFDVFQQFIRQGLAELFIDMSLIRCIIRISQPTRKDHQMLVAEHLEMLLEKLDAKDFTTIERAAIHNSVKVSKIFSSQCDKVEGFTM